MKAPISSPSRCSVSTRPAFPEIAASICPIEPGFPRPYRVSSRARRLWAWGFCRCASSSCPSPMPRATICVCATHTLEPSRCTRYSHPPKQSAVRLARSTRSPSPSPPPPSPTPAPAPPLPAEHMPSGQSGPLPGARPRHPLHCEQHISSGLSIASVCTPRMPARRFASSHASTMLSSDSAMSSGGTQVSGASVHPSLRHVSAMRSDTTTRAGSPSLPLSAR